jgi:hypothetical protein
MQLLPPKQIGAIMTKNTQQNLKIAIEKALDKIQGKREKEICRYIPGPRGGYIHCSKSLF